MCSKDVLFELVCILVTLASRLIGSLSDLDWNIDSNQLQLREPSYQEQDNAVKEGVLVDQTLIQQKHGQAYVKYVNLKECDQRLKKGVIAKSKPVIMPRQTVIMPRPR